MSSSTGLRSLDIPLDKYPSSKSSSKSTQSSNSFSGIGWTYPVASRVLPAISSHIGAITQLPYTVGQQAVGLAGDYAAQQNAMLQQLLPMLSTAYASGSGALQQAMQSAAQGVQQAYGTASELERAARYAARQAAQGNYGLNNVLQQLSAIGMLNSTTGTDVMSRALGEVLRSLSQQAYQAAAQGQQAIQDALRAQAQIASGVGSAYAPLGQMFTAGYGTSGSMVDQAAQRQLQAREFMANLTGALVTQALAELAGLDKYSSATYASTSTSDSSSSDPLAPYRLLADIMGLMS